MVEQAALLRGLGVGQLLAGSPAVRETYDAYWRLQVQGATLPAEELSRLVDSLLEGVSQPAIPPVPFQFRFQPDEAQPVVGGGVDKPRASRIPRKSPLLAAAGDQTSPPVSVVPAQGAAEEMVELVAGELGRVVTQYRRAQGTFEASRRQVVEGEFAVIEGRLLFWRRALEEAGGQPGPLSRPYREDIALGARLLLHRIVALAAEVFAEPILEQEDRPAAVGGEARPDEERRFLRSLKNRDVGFGNELSLREHQQYLLNRFRGLLRKMMMEGIEARTGPVRDLREGTIVMAQGGGKTRTMIASFGAALETGFFDATRGDKLIVLNHTDEIHSQNLKVSRLLGPYFRRKVGRPLKVTEYKAGQKDLSGDVVVVSIPTVATEEARRLFEERLRAALGGTGRIPLVAVDEIHHLSMGKGQTKESWREVIDSIRRISPSVYRVGFTATPTGREGPYIGKIRLPDLMRSGVTPRTYLRQVEGVDLSRLKVSVGSEDVSVRKLVSVLLQHPERNERLFEALEKDGLRCETASPSGRERLEPSLSFAADLQHARMMAEAYGSHFGGTGTGLRGRRLTLLGAERGRIDAAALEEALQAWREGRSDAITAVISGETPRKVRDEILEAVERGEIEAVFNVDVWAEGADLYPFTHLLGARPSFSKIKKGQEMGRLNRRGPSDVGEDGELIRDRPKILFDVVDDYLSFDRALVFYANLLDVGGVTRAARQLFDVFNGRVVERVDREGLEAVHQRLKEVMKGKRRRSATPRPEVPVWDPILARLGEFLASLYEGGLEAMAADLAMTEEGVEAVLDGRGLIDARWFLRRLATLLYQPRETFVSLYNEIRRLGDDRVTESDIELLWGAMAVFSRREKRAVGGEAEIIVSGTLPEWGDRRAAISQHAQWRLNEGAITDRVFRQIWRGLSLYFDLQRRQGEGAARGEAEAWFRRLRDHLFAREGWGEAVETARQRLLLKGREGLALVEGGRFPQKDSEEGVPKQLSHSTLNRWLAGAEIIFGRGLPPHDFYNQVQSLFRYFGLETATIENLVVAAVTEDQGWRDNLSTVAGRLLALARRHVALRFGGKLPVETGLPGVPQQYGAYHARGRDYEAAPLTRWLSGETIVFSRGLTQREFYRQVRALLEGLGVEVAVIDRHLSGIV